MKAPADIVRELCFYPIKLCERFLVLLEIRLAKEQQAGTIVVNDGTQSDAHGAELVQERLVKLFHRFLLSVPFGHKIIVLSAK